MVVLEYALLQEGTHLSHTAQVEANDVAQQNHFRQFLGWFAIAVLGFALMYAIFAWLWSNTGLLYVAGACAAGGLASLGGRGLTKRGQLLAAVALFYGVMVAGVAVIVAVVPDLYTTGVMCILSAFMVVLPFLKGQKLYGVLIATWVVNVILTVIGELYIGATVLPESFIVLARICSFVASLAFILLGIWQYNNRLQHTLMQLSNANMSLQQSQTVLESQVTERTAALSVALADVEKRAALQNQLLEEIEQQRDVIRDLSVPILPISRDVLIMPLVGSLDSTRLTLMQEQALHMLERSRARHLLLDITGVPLVDSQIAQGLIKVTHAARLLGAEVSLVGIRPEVAQTIVGLGLDLSDIHTHSELQSALAGV